MKDWAEDSWMQNEDKTWVLKPHIFSLYSTVAFFLIGLPVGRFAYRRLFVNNKPQVLARNLQTAVALRGRLFVARGKAERA